MLWAGLSVQRAVEVSDGNSSQNVEVLLREDELLFRQGVPILRSTEALDADITRLVRLADSRRDSLRFRVAGRQVVEEERAGEGFQRGGTAYPLALGTQEAAGSPRREGALDENPYLEEATAYYGVEWARDTLILVRFRESSNITSPCVVGASRERGPFQFLPSTWAGTPYADQDPCNFEAATWAAAWMVAQGRQYEFTTWPRGGTP